MAEHNALQQQLLISSNGRKVTWCCRGSFHNRGRCCRGSDVLSLQQYKAALIHHAVILDYGICAGHKAPYDTVRLSKMHWSTMQSAMLQAEGISKANPARRTSLDCNS